MNANAYRLLGFAVWNGGKWYLRRRLPSVRKLALGGVLTGGGIAAAVLAAKRFSG